jgi:hypothetical protein
MMNMDGGKELRLSHEIAGGDEMDEFTESVAFCFPVRLQTADGGLIGEV